MRKNAGKNASPGKSTRRLRRSLPPIRACWNASPAKPVNALRALGLAEMQAELDGIDSQKQALDQREQRARRFMLAIVRRVSVEDVSELSHGSPFAEVAHAIEKLQSVHEEELLAENLCGKEILRWRREKEHLQDAVWLATSPAQVKSLWQRVMELLGEEQTVLQKEALAMGNNGGCD